VARIILLTDTVGFIAKTSYRTRGCIPATLEEIADADLILHVLDITHTNAEQQTQTVNETLKQLESGQHARTDHPQQNRQIRWCRSN
jgi:GTP-binding protein HflX